MIKSKTIVTQNPQQLDQQLEEYLNAQADDSELVRMEFATSTSVAGEPVRQSFEIAGVKKEVSIPKLTMTFSVVLLVEYQEETKLERIAETV